MSKVPLYPLSEFRETQPPCLAHRPGTAYRGTSLIRNSPPLGPYSRTMSRVLWRSWGGGGSYERRSALRSCSQTRKREGLNLRGQKMPSPRPWEMITYFHSTVRNPS